MHPPTDSPAGCGRHPVFVLALVFEVWIGDAGVEIEDVHFPEDVFQGLVEPAADTASSGSAFDTNRALCRPGAGGPADKGSGMGAAQQALFLFCDQAGIVAQTCSIP